MTTLTIHGAEYEPGIVRSTFHLLTDFILAIILSFSPGNRGTESLSNLFAFIELERDLKLGCQAPKDEL